MEKYITAATFTYPHEITVLKHRLDLEGIHYIFENEGMISVAPMYSIAFGGIKLKIHPDDAQTVKRILDELNADNNLRIV